MFTPISITSTSSTLTHAAAWLQDSLGLDTLAAYGLVGAATYVLAVGAVVATATWAERPVRR